MPTGYTADIPKGITFEQFALSCARAFGALITMRDEPSGAPIPEEFEPSDYHSKAAAKAREELRNISKMPDAACKLAAQAEFDSDEESRLKRLAENAAQIESYRAMLGQVKEWAPPSPDHARMKEFMVEQIESSIKFDDSSEYYSKPTERKTGTQWRESKMGKLIKDIAYHDEEHQKEVERTSQRTRWVKQLRASLV